MFILKSAASWVKNALGRALDLLAPEDRKIQRLLELDAATMRNLLPSSKTRVKDLFVLFDYDNRIVKLVVRSIKYKNNAGLRKRIAEYLYDEIMEMSSDISLFDGAPPLLVPMPMSKKEKQKKGFNQCEELLKEVEKMVGGNLDISYTALRKIRETKRQTELGRDQRLLNVKNSMMADSSGVGHRTIIVLDDVYTTLASFSEARRVLFSVGARRVVGLFIAH